MEKLYENENGFIKMNPLNNIEVYKESTRNLDGIYDVSINHVYTLYDNGYIRNELLGKVYNAGLKTLDERKICAIEMLK